MTSGEDALVGQLARLLEAERDRLSPHRVLELLSLLLGERAQVGDASRYVYEYGRRAGYSLPALVHPRAYVSPTADIRPGAVVLALAAVGACAVVEQGAIVNMGAIADHDCVIGACAHLAPGAIVKAGNTVPAQMKIESGTVLERGAAFLPLGGQHV